MDPNTDQQWWQIEEIFAQALDLPEGQREAFLDEACEGDLYLKQQVKILLDTHKKAESFLGALGNARPARRHPEIGDQPQPLRLVPWVPSCKSCLPAR